MIRITEAVKHLLIINLIMFIGTLTIGNGELFYDWFALYFPKNDSFQLWQIITHMFMHGGFNHILFNMLALWMFGTAIEQVFGSKKFLFFYISSGLGAVLLTFIVYYVQMLPLLSEVGDLGYSKALIEQIINIDMASGSYLRGDILAEKMGVLLSDNGRSINELSQADFKAFFDMNRLSRNSMVGASGAIMGVLVAFGMLFPESKLMLIFLPIPIKAKYFIPGIILLDLFSALTGVSIFSPSNTAYVAHIGGALTGFLIMYFWRRNQFDRFRWN